MRNPKKISRIRLLMITSHLLLTFFVLQWLYSHFGREKDSLVKELTREFSSSEEKMLDSLLLEKIVDPFLQTQEKGHVKMFVMSDSGKINITDGLGVKVKGRNPQGLIKTFGIIHRNRNSSKDSIQGDTNNSIKIKADSLKITANFIVDSLKPTDLQEKFLIRSIKVLSDKVSDSNEPRNTISLRFAKGLDSAILIREFEKRTLINNFKLIWESNSKKPEDLSDIKFETKFLENSLMVYVLNYEFYLFRKIFPQIIFGLVLILLTGVAFIISFVSLKNQIQLNLIRADFVSNISHELKTPVSTVKVVLEALQSFNIKNEPAKADEYITIAQAELNRLDLLIQKVLTTSIYDDVHSIMQFEPLSLKNVVNEVIASMQIRLSQVDAKINVDFVNEELNVNADRLHIQGVLINLIDNSIKYVQGKPKISIKAFQDKEGIILTLSDNGIGIPSEYLGKVFDKFFRVPTENLHNVKGYGLGLSYAAMVMKHHNGTISVENQKEGGCKFTLSFPKG